MRFGIDISIDVTKLDKERFYKGKKGIYANLTMFIDTEVTGQYGDHGFLTQKISKEEKENGIKLPILGNAKIFFTEGGQAAARPDPYKQGEHLWNSSDSSDVPF